MANLGECRGGRGTRSPTSRTRGWWPPTTVLQVGDNAVEAGPVPASRAARGACAAATSARSERVDPAVNDRPILERGRRLDVVPGKPLEPVDRQVATAGVADQDADPPRSGVLEPREHAVRERGFV